MMVKTKYAIKNDQRHVYKINCAVNEHFLNQVKALQDYYVDQGKVKPTRTGIIFLAVSELCKLKNVKPKGE